MSVSNLQWAHTVPKGISWFHQLKLEIQSRQVRLETNFSLTSYSLKHRTRLHLQVSQRIQWEATTFFIRVWSTYKGLCFGVEVLPSNPSSVAYYLCNLRKITRLFILQCSRLLTKKWWTINIPWTSKRKSFKHWPSRNWRYIYIYI